MAQQSPSRDQNKYVVRLPAGMRERIAEAAKANNRSMNAEIVACLESSLSSQDNPIVALTRAAGEIVTQQKGFAEIMIKLSEKMDETTRIIKGLR